MKLAQLTYTNLMAQNDKLKLEMSNVIDSVKADKMVIHSLADKVYYDAQLEPPLFGTWQDWTLVGIGGTIVLIILQLMYLTVKIRKLMITVTVLKQICHVDGLVLKYQPTNVQAIANNATQSGLWLQEEILKKLEEFPWIWLFLGLLIGALITVIICWANNKCCKGKTVAGTIIGLNVTNGETGKIIKLMMCHAPMSDLDVKSTNAPSGLIVKGFLKPRLSFYWDGELKIKSLRLTKSIPNVALLTLAEARELKKIIKRNYLV